MADQNTPAESDSALRARQLAILGELADLGLNIARALTDQALRAEDATAHASAFARVSKSVRLSLMLQDKLAKAPKADPVEARKSAIKRIMIRIGERERQDHHRIERLTTERLETDFCGDILARPVSELIAVICKDLNLNPSWATLADEAWHSLEVAAAKSSPIGERGPREACAGGMTSAPPPPINPSSRTLPT